MRHTFFILLIFVPSFLWAQTKEDPVYNAHKSEVGINARNIFSGAIGTGIIFKKRFKFGDLVARNEKTAFRIQLGGSGQIQLNEREQALGDTISPLLFRDIFNRGYSVFGLVGVEWQKQKNRFQYFYGLDVGYRLSKTERLAGWTYSSRDGYTFRVNDEHRSAIPLIGFAGIKYFITPRIAIAMDSGFEINYEFGKTDITLINNSDGSEITIKDFDIQNINYAFRYLNMLNLSYFF